MLLIGIKSLGLGLWPAVPGLLHVVGLCREEITERVYASSAIVPTESFGLHCLSLRWMTGKVSKKYFSCRYLGGRKESRGAWANLLFFLAVQNLVWADDRADLGIDGSFHGGCVGVEWFDDFEVQPVWQLVNGPSLCASIWHWTNRTTNELSSA